MKIAMALLTVILTSFSAGAVHADPPTKIGSAKTIVFTKSIYIFDAANDSQNRKGRRYYLISNDGQTMARVSCESGDFLENNTLTMHVLAKPYFDIEDPSVVTFRTRVATAEDCKNKFAAYSQVSVTTPVQVTLP